MLYKDNSNSNHCLLSEHATASTRVRHTLSAAAVHPLEFEVSRCRTSEFARSLLPAQVRMWNDLPYTVFDSGTLDGFKSAVNRWQYPRVVFSFSVTQVPVWLRTKIINNFVFLTFPRAADFNNNNNFEKSKQISSALFDFYKSSNILLWCSISWERQDLQRWKPGVRASGVYCLGLFFSCVSRNWFKYFENIFSSIFFQMLCKDNRTVVLMLVPGASLLYWCNDGSFKIKLYFPSIQ